MKICQDCGTSNTDKSHVCTNCGAELPPTQKPSIFDKPEDKEILKKPLPPRKESAFRRLLNAAPKLRVREIILTAGTAVVAIAIGFGFGRIGQMSKTPYAEAIAKIDQLTARNAELSTQISQYEAIIQPYKDLSDAQIAEQTAAANLKAQEDAEALAAKQAEEERIAAEKAAAEKAAAEKAAAEKAAAEKAAAEAAAAEKAKGYETGITYDQLARTPDSYIGKKVKFTGKVLQVIEGTSETQIRLAVNEDYDTVLLCSLDKSLTSSTRILEDDKILIMGTSLGLISYQSTLGGTITIPGVIVEDWGPNY